MDTICKIGWLARDKKKRIPGVTQAIKNKELNGSWESCLQCHAWLQHVPIYTKKTCFDFVSSNIPYFDFWWRGCA